MPTGVPVVTSLMVWRYGTPFRKASASAPEPRLGIEPRLFENDSVSSVRFSSSTLSAGSVVLIGPGICVGVVVLSGRKIVLNPCPVNVPVKADNGPSVGGSVKGTAAGAAACAAALNTVSTWWIEKFEVLENVLVSGLGSSMGRSFRWLQARLSMPVRTREAAFASLGPARRGTEFFEADRDLLSRRPAHPERGDALPIPTPCSKMNDRKTDTGSCVPFALVTS